MIDYPKFFQIELVEHPKKSFLPSKKKKKTFSEKKPSSDPIGKSSYGLEKGG